MWLQVDNKELERVSHLKRKAIWMARVALVKAGLIEEDTYPAVPHVKTMKEVEKPEIKIVEAYQGVQISITEEGQLKLWSPDKSLSLKMTEEERRVIGDRKAEDGVRIAVVKKLIREGTREEK